MHPRGQRALVAEVEARDVVQSPLELRHGQRVDAGADRDEPVQCVWVGREEGCAEAWRRRVEWRVAAVGQGVGGVVLR